MSECLHLSYLERLIIQTSVLQQVKSRSIQQSGESVFFIYSKTFIHVQANSHRTSPTHDWNQQGTLLLL